MGNVFLTSRLALVIPSGTVAPKLSRFRGKGELQSHWVLPRRPLLYPLKEKLSTGNIRRICFSGQANERPETRAVKVPGRFSGAPAAGPLDRRACQAGRQAFTVVSWVASVASGNSCCQPRTLSCRFLPDAAAFRRADLIDRGRPTTYTPR